MIKMYYQRKKRKEIEQKKKDILTEKPNIKNFKTLTQSI